ncbi:S8 family serine peptidase [Streptomyces sp. NPDC006529]|uniref:S8 family serine peptidase n=1 Tax=Streptomyces sp. NPDC006529 TaxID=3157177 RepID=UPI0033B1FBDA
MTTRTTLVLAAVAAALALAAPAATASPSAAAPEPTPAPLSSAPHPVPGSYIVILHKGADPAAVAEQLGVKPAFVYRKALNGFAVTLTPDQLESVRVSPGVKAVEQDAEVTRPPRPVTEPGTRAPAASWGLDRIDQRNWNADQGTGDGRYDARHDGAGVSAYILDTGIDYAHEEFDGGRATFGFDAVGDGAPAWTATATARTSRARSAAGPTGWRPRRT